MDNRATENEVDWPTELDTLLYFWEQKGDLERYTGWADLKPALQIRYPEIVAAWDGYLLSRRTLSAVLKGVSVT